MDLLIWSKNRAAQLDLLLHSIEINEYPFDCHVLYRADESHAESYNKLKKEYAHFSFIKEDKFEEDTKYILDKFSGVFGFSTDDTVFWRKNPWNIDFTEFSDVFSYRYGFNTRVQDPHRGTIQPDLFRYESINEKGKDKVIRWDFNDYHPHANYGYPFGLDGHFYSPRVKKIIMDLDFRNTNELETALFHQKKNIRPYIMSFSKSCCVNIPANNMSGVTRAGEKHGYTIDELRDLYMRGGRLAVRFANNEPVGAHQEYTFSEVYLDKLR